MDFRFQSVAEKAAQFLVETYRQHHPSWEREDVPLDDLAAWLGLPIATFHPDDFSHGTYGFLDPDEDEPLVWLQRDMPETFRRFTLAHELGHVLLHSHSWQKLDNLPSSLRQLITPLQQAESQPSPNDPCSQEDIQESLNASQSEEDVQLILGPGLTYDPRSQRELAANFFAAELLIPLERLRSLYFEESLPPQTLAQIFGVSQAALLNRLATLLKPNETPQSSNLPTRQEDTPQTSKKHYDSFQQEAIEAPTPTLVVAGPGSGKTSTLIGRVDYLIKTTQIPPEQILALTFSRKAAQEMLERLQSLLPDSSTLPTVSTFHAFCAEQLRTYGTRVGLKSDFTLIDEAEGFFFLRQHLSSLHLRHYQKLQAPTYYFSDLLKAISRAKDELISPQQYTSLAYEMLKSAVEEEEIIAAEKAIEVSKVYVLYEKELRRRGDCDFGGLIAHTVELLQSFPEILNELQQRYQHILVDEFQDMNRASAILLRTLTGKQKNVWVVGDANQAIYGFRGASPANIRQFSNDFPGATTLHLSRNYRSRPELVELAEHFRAKHLEPDTTRGINQAVREPFPTPPITLAQAENEPNEIASLVASIQRQIQAGYKYSEIMVLCRTRSHVRKITSALARAGLPIREEEQLLEKVSIKNILAMLSLLSNPSGAGLLRLASIPTHTISQTDLEIFLASAHEQRIAPLTLLLVGPFPLTISVEGQQALSRLANLVRTLQYAPDIWNTLAQYLLIETDIVRNLLQDPQARSLLEDYDHLLRLARHFDQRKHLHPYGKTEEENTTSQAPLVDRIRTFLDYLRLLISLRQEQRSKQTEENEEQSKNTIQVITVHASKGLEFPVVYLPGLAQRRFPSQIRPQPIAPPAGMLPADWQGEAAHESGEACLFYVGLTRARDQLILSYSDRYGKIAYKPSVYLSLLEESFPQAYWQQVYWTHTAKQPMIDEASIQTSYQQPSEHFIQRMEASTLRSSAIGSYQRCPRSYAYQSIYHFEDEHDGYSLFRQSMQKTLATLARQAELPEEEEIQRSYQEHWEAAGGPTTHFSQLYEKHSSDILRRLRNELVEAQTWQLRKQVSVEMGGKSIQVTIDRVEQKEEQQAPEFVRTRYGNKQSKPSPELPELFYTLAHRQQYPGENLALQSHNLSTGERQQTKIGAKKEQRLYEEALRCLDGILQHSYPAAPKEATNCSQCPFSFICPA